MKTRVNIHRSRTGYSIEFNDGQAVMLYGDAQAYVMHVMQRALQAAKLWADGDLTHMIDVEINANGSNEILHMQENRVTAICRAPASFVRHALAEKYTTELRGLIGKITMDLGLRIEATSASVEATGSTVTIRNVVDLVVH